MPGDVLFCTDTFWDEHAEFFVALDPTIEVVRLVDDEHVTEGDLERVTIAFFSPDTWPDRTRSFIGTVVRCPNLRWLQIAFAGTDHPVFQRLMDRGVTISNASGATAPAIAQTVMMYLLTLSRDLLGHERARDERRWTPDRNIDLHDMKLGIVGYGAIGAEVGRLAQAFGMQPIGLRRTVTGDESIEVWPNDRLGDLLDWADAIVVSAPLTDDTRGMFGAAEFARMRPGSWFVNVGRGQICDEDALIDALTDGHLGGAGLDVFATEPLPPDSPIWTLPNVVMTPHCSGDSTRSDRRAVEIMLDNFRRHACGEPIENVVG